MKKDSTPVARAVEILAFTLVIGIINMFTPENPGFLNGFFNPYITLSLFIAVYYGKYYAFLSLGFSALVVAFGLPLAAKLISGSGALIPERYWPTLWGLAPVPCAVALVQAYLIGLVRDSLTRRDRDAKGRIVAFSRDKGLLNRQVRALKAANLELEERISRQEDSITSLYSQIQVLGSLNLDKALLAILENVRRFIGASRCSIWEHRPEERNLQLVASLGWEQGAESRTIIPDENTIEGWVVRNNMVFSVKMLLENDALARLDSGRNIMTLPISAGRRIWGVLNVEEMPFVKYNLYAERLLHMIMALAGPALERTIEYQSVMRQEDIHPFTGLPSFSQFYALLQRELARLAVENGTLAILVLELLNFSPLAEEHGKEAVFALQLELARMVQELSAGKARFFHYKAEPQLAVIYPNLDSDGASLFSLTVLEKVNARQWRLKDARVYLEMILGFSVRSGAESSPEELLEAAENLLEMQKV